MGLKYVQTPKNKILQKKGVIFSLDSVVAIVVLVLFVMISYKNAVYHVDTESVTFIRATDSLSELLQKSGYLEQAIISANVEDMQRFLNQTLDFQYCGNVTIYNQSGSQLAGTQKSNCSYSEQDASDIAASYVSFLVDNTFYYAKVLLWIKGSQREYSLYQNCLDIYVNVEDATSDNYQIDIDGIGTEPIQTVYCDMSQGGGWTRINANVTSDIDRLAWATSDSSITNTSCFDCDGTWPKAVRDHTATLQSYVRYRVGSAFNYTQIRVDTVVAATGSVLYTNISHIRSDSLVQLNGVQDYVYYR